MYILACPRLLLELLKNTRSPGFKAFLLVILIPVEQFACVAAVRGKLTPNSLNT